MKRDPRAFLNDIVDAGGAILDAIKRIDLDQYEESRLIRSSVEREFTIIGEALSRLSQYDRAILVKSGKHLKSFRLETRSPTNTPKSTADWSGESSRPSCQS